MNNELKELRLGILTNQQLASWFGIKPGTFSSKKKEKLKELRAYADFEEVGKKQTKVKINKIYQSKYYKKGSQAYEKIKSLFNETWSEDGLDSCKRVCYEILDTVDLSCIQDSTAYNYTLRSRNDLFGKPFQQPGKLGRCEYVWCKQGEDGKLRFLTREQEQIKSFLIKKYFGNASEKQIIVQAMVDAGEITQAEAWRVLTEMTNMKGSNFMSFLKQLQATLGCKVIRGTVIERYYLQQEGSAF